MIPGVEGFSPGLRLCRLIAGMFGTDTMYTWPRARRRRRETPLTSGCTARKTRTLLGTNFRRYSIASSVIPVTERFHPIAWWSQPDIEEAFPTLQRWPFDVFACPATSCECERAFSRAKKLITPERNLLGDNIIEALECLRAWWNIGLVKRL